MSGCERVHHPWTFRSFLSTPNAEWQWSFLSTPSAAQQVGMNALGECVEGHQNVIKSTILPSRVVGSCFLWFEIVSLWFSLSFAVVTCGFLFLLAAFVWRNVKFPTGSQLWQPEEPCNSAKQKPVPSHLPHHKKQQQFSQTVEEKYGISATSAQTTSAAPTAPAAE